MRLTKTRLLLCATLTIWSLPAYTQDAEIRYRARQAIEAGSAGEAPQPYLLRYAEHDGDGEQSVVIGAIYTPFLRVAIAAAQRAKEQRTLSVPEAEAILTENVFYAALRWRDQDQMNLGSAPIQVLAVPRNSGYFNETVGVAPIWIAPGERASTVLRQQPLWDDVGAIVAFPHELFSPDYDFVIFKSTVGRVVGSGRRQHARARIARADHGRWIW
jgi:hypothetical protein